MPHFITSVNSVDLVISFQRSVSIRDQW